MKKLECLEMAAAGFVIGCCVMILRYKGGR